MVRMRVQGRGFAQTRHVLREMRRRSRHFIEDLSPRLIAHLEEVSEEFFDREGGPNGAWAPLAPLTVELKGHDIILYARGHLSSSLTAQTQYSIRRTKPLLLEFGTTIPYADKHEYGGTSPSGREVPARPFLPTPRYYLPRFTRWSADYIVGLGPFKIRSVQEG